MYMYIIYLQHGYAECALIQSVGHLAFSQALNTADFIFWSPPKTPHYTLKRIKISSGNQVHSQQRPFRMLKRFFPLECDIFLLEVNVGIMGWISKLDAGVYTV